MSELTEHLQERIKQLEIENGKLKMENQILKNTNEPRQPTALQTYEFEMDMRPDTKEEDARSERWEVDGVELSVLLKKHMKQDPGQRSLKFIPSCSLYAKNKSDKQAFVMTTMEVKEKVESARGDPTIRRVLLCEPKKQYFVLGSEHTQEDESYGTLFIPKPPLMGIYYVQITVAVERIDSMELDDEWNTTVIVKDKEFKVSAQYLSLWSRYFRAYFSVDMKEKKEGRYPINDEDISAEDFEELLQVIYPTDKPITARNYKRLLKLASRFEMPELTRRIELFLLDFDRNEQSRAKVFRIASDLFHLKLVQATLLHRWKNSKLLQDELLRSAEYKNLTAETKAMVNARFADATIAAAEGRGRGCCEAHSSRPRFGDPRRGGGFGGRDGRGFGGGFGERDRDDYFGRNGDDDYYERDDEAEREAMNAREEVDEMDDAW